MTELVAYLISAGFTIRNVYSRYSQEGSILMYHENLNELDISELVVEGRINDKWYNSNKGDTWDTILAAIQKRLEN